MEATSIRLGVVGGGQMGAGIAETAIRAGVPTVVVEADEATAAATAQRIARSLERRVEKGALEERERAAVLEWLRTTEDLGALHDRTHVIEAVVEEEAAKGRVFEAVDRVVASDEAVLATNTSSLPITRLAQFTGRPDAVIGLHFFNPVPALPLVELVPGTQTSPATRERARAFVEDVLGNHAIWATDRAGFIVNGLLMPFLCQAIRMVENGFATAEDVDAGMVHGCNHPMGPLALADLIGLDTMLAVAEVLYAEHGESQYAPPPLLRRKVEAGQLGRKSGAGFYTY